MKRLKILILTIILYMCMSYPIYAFDYQNNNFYNNYFKIHEALSSSQIDEFLSHKESKKLEQPKILDIQHENNTIYVMTNYFIKYKEYTFQVYQDEKFIEEISVENQIAETLNLHINNHLQENKIYTLKIKKENGNFEVSQSFSANYTADFWQTEYNMISSHLVEITLNQSVNKVGILYSDDFEGYIKSNTHNKLLIYSEKEFEKNKIYNFTIKYSNNNYNENNNIYGYFQYEDDNLNNLSIVNHEYVNPYEIKFYFNYHITPTHFRINKFTLNDENVSFDNTYIQSENSIIVKTVKPITNGNYSIEFSNLKDTFYQSYNDVQYEFIINEIEEHQLMGQLENLSFIDYKTLVFQAPSNIKEKVLKNANNYHIKDIYSNKSYAIKNIIIEDNQVKIMLDINKLNRSIFVSTNFLLPDNKWYGYTINNGDTVRKSAIEDVSKIFLEDSELGEGYYIQFKGIFNQDVDLNNIQFFIDEKSIELKGFQDNNKIYFKLTKDISNKLLIKVNEEKFQHYSKTISINRSEQLRVTAEYINNIIRLSFNDYQVSIQKDNISINDKENKQVDFQLIKNEKISNTYYVKLNSRSIKSISSINLTDISSYRYEKKQLNISSFSPIPFNKDIIQSAHIVNDTHISISLLKNYTLNDNQVIGLIDEKNNHLLSIQDISFNNNEIIITTHEPIQHHVGLTIFGKSISHKYLPYTLKENKYYNLVKMDNVNPISEYVNTEKYNTSQSQILYTDDYVKGEKNAVLSNNFLVLVADNKILGTITSNDDGSFDKIPIPVNYRHYKEFKLYSIKENGVSDYIEIIKQ